MITVEMSTFKHQIAIEPIKSRVPKLSQWQPENACLAKQVMNLELALCHNLLQNRLFSCYECILVRLASYDFETELLLHYLLCSNNTLS